MRNHRNNSRTAWTDDKVEELRALAQRGLGAEQIASVMGRSRKVITNKASQAGIRLFRRSGDAAMLRRIIDRIIDRRKAKGF